MFRRLIAIVTFGAILALPLNAQQLNQSSATEQARADVQRLGIGKKARVEVKLRDNTRLKGYISAAEHETFTVTNSDSGSDSVVNYTDVLQVKKRSGGLSTKTWLTIGAVAAGVVVTGIILKPAVCDGGAQTRFPC
jgi:hypothetical protein